MGDWRFVEGIARKVSLIFVGLSFIGWIVFVAGYATYLDEINFSGDDPSFYPYWVASVVGPVLHILAVIHAVLWGFPSSIVGSITAMLSVMYLTAIGFVMVFYGIIIDSTSAIPGFVNFNYTNLLFAGGFLTTIFWAVHMAFWPWFKKDLAEERDYSTA